MMMNVLCGCVGVCIFWLNFQLDVGGGVVMLYFMVDVLYDFLLLGQIVVGGMLFVMYFGCIWYEFGVGVIVGFGKLGELYVNVKIVCNIGGDYWCGIVGQVGYWYSW